MRSPFSEIHWPKSPFSSTMFSKKKMIITYSLLLLLENEAACHKIPIPLTALTLQIFFHCVTGIKNVTTLQDQILMRGKSVSEQNFSGEGYNFRVFQGFFPGAKKIQGFSGSSRVSRFVGHPLIACHVHK